MTTRTKEERLASLNSRLEHAKSRLSQEKSKLYRLQNIYREAREQATQVENLMHKQGAREFPASFDTHALGKAKKAWDAQKPIVEALEADINRILDRIDEIKGN